MKLKTAGLLDLRDVPVLNGGGMTVSYYKEYYMNLHEYKI